MSLQPILHQGGTTLATAAVATTLNALASIGTNYRGFSIRSLPINEMFAFALIGKVAYEVLTHTPGCKHYLQTHPILKEIKKPIPIYTKREIGAHIFVAILSSTVTAAGAVHLYGLPFSHALKSAIALTVTIAAWCWGTNRVIAHKNGILEFKKFLKDFITFTRDTPNYAKQTLDSLAYCAYIFDCLPYLAFFEAIPYLMVNTKAP